MNANPKERNAVSAFVKAKESKLTPFAAAFILGSKTIEPTTMPNAFATSTTVSQLSINTLIESIEPFSVSSLALPIELSITSILSFKLEILPCKVSAWISCIL